MHRPLLPSRNARASVVAGRKQVSLHKRPCQDQVFKDATADGASLQAKMYWVILFSAPREHIRVNA
jgi:hypothetical protein